MEEAFENSIGTKGDDNTAITPENCISVRIRCLKVPDSDRYMVDILDAFLRRSPSKDLNFPSLDHSGRCIEKFQQIMARAYDFFSLNNMRKPSA